MNTTFDQTKLHHVLNANAMFSFTSGLFFLLGRQPLGGFLNAAPAVMLALSFIMFGYAALIASQTMRGTIRRGFALFTALADSTWVLLSILLLVLPVFDFTSGAKWAIGVTTICVDAFATLQFLEWRKMN